MPVLSEHIIVVHPRVSTAGSLLMIPFCLAISRTPLANIIVTMAGSPSGIAATARLTAVININAGSLPSIMPATNIIPHIISAIILNIFPVSPNFFCKGVSGALSSISKLASFPSSVFLPVAVTTALPCP